MFENEIAGHGGSASRKTWYARERGLAIPEIMLIAGTRIALGAGVGLLLADKLNDDQRKGGGWALIAIGALTSVPLVMSILNKPQIPHGT
jgi:hypothetical protein